MTLSLSLFALAGALAWTLLEYFIHRELGHRFTANPFGAEHVAHHATTRYFAASWKKAAVSAPIIAAVGLALAWPLGLAEGAAFAGGLGALYVLYEVLHRRAHVRAPRGPYGRWLRRHHFHHHFQAPRANFGVTTPLWDAVFGTLERPDLVRVPEKHAMPWLLEAEVAHARDFVVVRRRATCRA